MTLMLVEREKLYGKIGHLPGSRVGPAERHVPVALQSRCTGAGKAGDRVIVCEKLDGSCVAARVLFGKAHAFGRDGKPCADSKNDGRRAFAEWVVTHRERFAGLGERQRLMIEWLMHAHGTRYDLPHGPAVVIDGFDEYGDRWPLDVVHAKAREAGLPYAAVLHDGAPLAIADALRSLGAHGLHGAIDEAEGVVYRVEHGGEVVGLAKYVRPGKVDGRYLSDHTGRDHVSNTWRDEP